MSKIYTLNSKKLLKMFLMSGGYRILTTMENLKLQIPAIETSPEKTTLVLWKTTNQSFIESLPKHLQPAYQVISDSILATFSDVRKAYSSEYQARKALKEMVQNGIIDKVGKGPATKYAITKDSPHGKHLIFQYINSLKNLYDD
ncbi:hypothetical protein O0Z71_08095 [Ligilactobacillus saerimneri]|uniref:hypothetical protein n=1 Tax=Ligilactobacillus saerimneri TaxID=228229 RepID=UPI0022A7E36D|nr:hypothetical protein [Ligilactobacillus saerimneri]MCZ0892384.1 hypothetical protein [Ligilactobacillus saerimneri]